MAGTPAPSPAAATASRNGPWPAVRRRALALAVAVATLAAAPASAQGPDALAQTIDQNLSGIEFRIDLTPERTVRDVREQGRQLRLLESQAPDHPMIPELRQRIDRLEAQLTEELGDDPARAASEAMTRPGATSAAAVPGDVAARIEEVERELAEAESGLLQNAPEAAAERLARAEETLAAIERDHADQLPVGHVPLIVARERIATLRDQLAPATSR